jgi:predicted RNA binding protein with dsRBD fold (UPF0201 family)
VGSEPRPFDADFIGETPSRTKVKTRHQKRMLRAKGAAPAKPFMHVPLVAEVAVSVRVFPTEDPARVKAAVAAIFPDARFQGEGSAGAISARARDMRRMAEILRHSRIRDTARQVLKDALGADGVIRLHLNKQAATAARVNFVTGAEVLGALEVEISAPDPDALAEELTWIEGESDERLFGTKLHLHPERRSRRV